MRATKGNTVLIKFTCEGRWAEELTFSNEQFDVVPGQERMVSMVLADLIVTSGKGEYVDLSRPDTVDLKRPKRRPGPKPKNETGPVPKAEAK